jgi:hypothetical protein
MNAIQSMPRSQRRAAEAFLRAENLKWPETLKLWPREEWPTGMSGTPGVIGVYRSRGFLVQVFGEPAPVVVRLSIIRTAIKSNGDWQENITWEELQRLKREAGYGDFDAVEVYPPESDVVNVANLRHLWILQPGNLPFAWRKQGGSA